MNIKNNIVTIIVGDGIKSSQYQDGSMIERPNKIKVRHIEELQEVAKLLGISETSSSEFEMMKILAKYGHIVILNYGSINRKQSGIVVLPSQISEKQFNILELLKNEFTTEYEVITSCAIPNKPLAYKGDLKQMEYEDKIAGRVLNNVESLYYEIYEQKDILDKMERLNEQHKNK